MVNITEDAIIPESPNVHSQQTATFYAPDAGKYTEDDEDGTYKKGVCSFFDEHFNVNQGRVRLKPEYLTKELADKLKFALEQIDKVKEEVLSLLDGTFEVDKLLIGDGEALGQHSIAGGTTDLDLIKSVLGSGYAELINKYGSAVDSIPDSIISAILTATGADYTIAEFRQMIKVSPSKADGPLTLSYGTSNTSYAPVSSSVGYNNTVGAKGYRVFNIGPATSSDPAEIRISVGDIPRRVDSYVAPNPDVLGEWQPGDRLYVSAGGKRFITKLIRWRVKDYDVGGYPGYRLRVERDVSDVTVESAKSVSIPLDKTYYLADLNDNFVINLDRPTAGEVELGWGAIATGALNTALGNSSLALGYRNLVLGIFGTALGQENKAGDMAFAGGVKSEATGKGSISFGNENVASGEYAVALGGDNTASGKRSVALGNENEASGECSFAEGTNTTASGKYSHAQNEETTASGESSTAEGYKTVASGNQAHAGGRETVASARNSTAFGFRTEANHEQSFTSGRNLITGRENQIVVGEWNEIDENALYVVGNGKGPEDRRNAFTVNKDGTAYLNGKNITTEEYAKVKCSDREVPATDTTSAYKRHTISQGGNVVCVIDVPRDLVVKSGYVDGSTDELVLVLINDEEIRVDVSHLIEYITGGTADDGVITINVSDDFKVTATINNGTIKPEKFHSDVNTYVDNRIEAKLKTETWTFTLDDGSIVTKVVCVK